MSEQEYLKQLKRALLAHGVWDASATKIIEQLSDHYRSAMREFQEEGKSEQEARESVEGILGSPQIVAQASAEELRKQTYFGRHPWLVGGLGFFLGVLGCEIGILLAGVYFANSWGPDIDVSSLGVRATVLMFNWLPWILGYLAVFYIARRLSIGWKAIMIASCAVALSSNSTVALIHTAEGYCPVTVEFQTGTTLVTCLGWIFFLKKRKF